MPMPLTGEITMEFSIISPEIVSPESRYSPSPVLAPFSEDSVAFVEAFADTLFQHPLVRKYPELVSLAFWMRRARIEQMKKEFELSCGDRVVQGRGVVFHIAPANVDTIFVYSWFLSLLVGNNNIVRLSGKTGNQYGIIVDVVNRLFEQERFSAIRDRTLLVRYGHDDKVTEYFSSVCDVRVIWGGDATIRHIRTLPLPATSLEIPFADKFSLCVIDAGNFLQRDVQRQLVENFYNDAYWFSQMACSSPRLVVWLGDGNTVRQAQEIFWGLVEARAREEPPDLAEADVMNKYVACCMMAAEGGTMDIRQDSRGTVHRVQLRDLSGVDTGKHCGTGLFFEVRIEALRELVPWLNRKNQTVTSIGLDRSQWVAFLQKYMPDGIDRIVPVGQALKFSPVWDGINLLDSFCREITVEVQ